MDKKVLSKSIIRCCRYIPNIFEFCSRKGASVFNMVVKQTSIILLMFVCIIPQVYGNISENQIKAQRLGDFISWQKQLVWNSEGELQRFEELDASSLVIPLTGQWGLNARNMNPVEQLRWLHDGKLPLVLFGEKAGVSPLYCGLTYRFGVHTGSHILEKPNPKSQQHLRILVYDRESPASENHKPIYEETIQIPLNKVKNEDGNLKTAFKAQWDDAYLDKSGGLMQVGSSILHDRYGLESLIQYTASSFAWGRNDGSGIIFSHRCQTNKFTFVIQLLHSDKQTFESLYVLDFSPMPPESAHLLLQPTFMREPKPSGYWGVDSIKNEHIRLTRRFCTQMILLRDPDHKKYWADDSELFGLFSADIKAEDSDSKRINRIYKKTLTNTQVSYAQLDEFVRERRDALTLASFVQNEIELIDGASVPEKGEALTIYPGKINRSPLTTFLEGQGSPWEQCELLVYLLRQAGYAAAYVESKDPLLFSKNDFSRLLHVQLNKALKYVHLTTAGYADPEDSFSDPKDNALIRVCYPWVAHYDEIQKKWVHIFPWIKDTKITEGYDLYGLMPERYKSGMAWVRNYLENDPRIFKHVKEDGNDTVSVLFKRFVEEVAKEKGINPDAIGVRYQNIKKNYSSFDDFPKPINFEGEAIFSDSLKNREDLYTTVHIEITSLENPESKLTTTTAMRLADIHNRALYIYFSPISDKPNETRHEMVLRMEGIDGFTREEAGVFDQINLDGTQEKRVLLDTDDHTFEVHITYDQKTNGMLSFPEMFMRNKIETHYYIQRGTLASICFNVNRVTKKMLETHASRFTLTDKVNGDYHDVLGRLTYLAGMSFYEKTAAGIKTLSDLHKIENEVNYEAGLSELSPEISRKSLNINAVGEFVGQPVFRIPKVDMVLQLKQTANASIRPDLGEEATSVKMNYAVLAIANGSSNEHQIIKDFYGDSFAISTVKLLQLAHKRHVASGKSGTGFLVFTRGSLEDANLNPEQATNRYFSHIKNLDLAKVIEGNMNQWTMLCRHFSWSDEEKTFWDDDADTYHSIAYMTPGEVASEDGDLNDHKNQPSFIGEGLLFVTPYARAALISSSNIGVMNGGYGGFLPENTFAKENIPNIEINWEDGSPKAEGFEKAKPTDKEYFAFPKIRDAYDLENYFKTVPEELLELKNMDVRQAWINAPSFQADRFFSDDQYYDFSSYFQDYGTAQEQVSFEQAYKEVLDFGGLSSGAFDEYKAMYRDLADPVDIVTGAFQVQVEDLVIDGPLPIKLQRNYSSANPFFSEFGYGWKRNLVPYLVFKSKKQQSDCIDSEIIQAAESDGTVVVYRKQSETYWRALPDDNPHIVGSRDASLGKNIFFSNITKETKNNIDNYYLHGADGSVRSYRVGSFPVAGIERKRPYLYSWADAEGNVISFEYGENEDRYNYGQVKKITNAGGDFIELHYDEYNHIIEASAKDGRRVSYSYDIFGDLESVILPDDTVIRYTYAHEVANKNDKITFYSNHKMTHEEKPNGRVLQNIYDESGRVIEQKTTRAQGKLVTNAEFAYLKDKDAENAMSIREVRDANGGLTRYKLYGSLITEIIDPLGNKVYQSWYLEKDKDGKQKFFDAYKQSVQIDQSGFSGFTNQLKTKVDKRGLRTSYGYDSEGNLIKKMVTGSDLLGDGELRAMLTKYSYDGSGRLESVIGENSKGTYLLYENSRYPKLTTRVEKRIEDKTSFVKEYTYGDVGVHKGLLLKEKLYDPKKPDSQIEVLYEYDFCGLPIKGTYKKEGVADVVIKFEYDLQNNLARKILDSGAYTKYLHDNMNRLIGEIKYDAKGKEQSATYYHYNENGELEWIKGPRHEKDYTLFNYDAAGNQVFKARWQFQIDNLDALEMKVEPIPGYQSFASQAIELRQFNMLDKLTHDFDAEGHVTEYAYDNMGQIKKRTIRESLDGKILSDESYEYEPGGFVAKIIHADKSIISKFYTASGLLKREEYPNGSKHIWSYDAEARVVSEVTEAGALWDITYDDLNRKVIRQENKIGITEVIKKDLQGNVTETIDGNGNSTYYSYDAIGRFISEQNNNETVLQVYDHDVKGNLITEKISADGKRIKQVTDLSGKPIEISWYESGSMIPSQKTSYQYYPGGRTCVVGGSDETLRCYFDSPNGNRLIDWEYFGNFQDPGHDLMIGNQYNYDRNENLVSYIIPGMCTSSYSYNGLGCLIKEQIDGRAPTLFDYDSMERLTHRDLPMGLVWNKDYTSQSENSERSIWDGKVLQGSNYKEVDANTVNVIDLNNNVAVYHKDVLGRTEKVVISNPNGYKSITTYSYDNVGNVLEIEKNDVDGNTKIERTYDAAGHILNEKIILNNNVIAEWKQKWNADNRASLVFEDNMQIAAWSFSYNARKQLSSLEYSGSGKKLNWNYKYSEVGLLKERSTPWKPIMFEYDHGGHVEQQYLGLNLLQKLAWKLDGKMLANIFNPETDLMKGLSYSYNDQGRLNAEGLITDLNTESPSVLYKTDYVFDWDSSEGLGINSGAVTQGSFSFAHEIAKNENTLYARPEVETFFGIDHNRLLRTSLVVEEQNNYTDNMFGAETLSTQYDSMGRVIERSFGGSGQKQIINWDPQGNLLSVTLKNNNNTVLSQWRAFYDGLDRRIKTVFIPYKNDQPELNREITQISLYDPEVEFLELGVVVQVGKQNPRTIWKVYGASNSDGVYGKNNGYTGLEAVIEDDTGEAYGIINGLDGNIIATIDNTNQIDWKKITPSSYGPLNIPSSLDIEAASVPGKLAQIIIDSNIWKNKRIDPTGFINFGVRHYDPLTKRFLSCDPLGHAATPDLYSYADGDPVNNIDSDGRFASEVYDALTPEDMVSMGLDFTPGIGNAKGLLETTVGYDPITGEPVNRWISGAGVAIPFAAGIGKLGKFGKLASKSSAGTEKGLFKVGAKEVRRKSEIDGITYERISRKTGEKYIGQSKSPKHYQIRQRAHNRNLNQEHKYRILDENVPTKRKLDYLEEMRIREDGGIQKEGGSLANKRHQMNEARYREAEAKFNGPN